MSEPTVGLPAIDPGVLTPMVRQSLQQPRAEVVGWQHEPFGHSLDEVYGTARSVYRVTGAARVGDTELPWALVLKVVTAPGTPDDPASPANGAREPLAYQSGLLSDLVGLRAPSCFDVVERPIGGYWLWLEDVADEIGREWPMERYLLAARHLARFNATPRDAATAPVWLSRSPLREAVREMAPGVARLRDARDNPLVAQAITPEAAASLLALLDQADGWLDHLDTLPQVLCHWDAHRANLMSRTTRTGDVETVAIDWAGVGWGAVGSELSKLLSQTVNFFGMPPEALPALDARLFEHYMEGLRDVGWTGDQDSVRFGYTAASAMRLVVRTSTALELAFNARAREGFERATGLPFSTLAAKFGATLPYYVSLVDEASRLRRRA
jgi:hypothetical protein